MRLGVAELQLRQAFRRYLQERDVGAGIAAHELCRELAPVFQGDDDFLGLFDDVVVGDHVASAGRR